MFSAANPNSVAFVPSIEWFAVSCNTHTHTHTLTHCDTHWHTHRLTDWQTDRLTDWQTDTLTHWQTQTLTRWHTDTLTYSHTHTCLNLLVCILFHQLALCQIRSAVIPAPGKSFIIADYGYLDSLQMFACVGKHKDDQRLILRFWLGRHFGLDMLGCFTEVSATPNQSMDAKRSLGAARPNLTPSEKWMHSSSAAHFCPQAQWPLIVLNFEMLPEPSVTI